MQKTTFKIRRKIILAFLFSLLSVLIFSAFSFQVHREIGHRLRLLELTNDMFQTILELRRVEKNFFLYRQVASLNEAETYLTHARAERPEFEALSIGTVIQDTLKLVRNQLTLSGIHVEQDVPADLTPIRGEKKSLQQVFLKLFINSIQAMLDGGALKIRAHPSPDGQWMVIDVMDTGVGIDPEHLSQIFDPFYTTKQVGRGTGLGLSVTYGIVEKHGGHIEVKSSKGAGATFTLTLPLEKAA